MRDKFVLTRGMLILFILIILIIVGIIVGINILGEHNIEKYKEYEKQLEEQTKNYYSLYYLEEGKKLKDNTTEKVTMKRLIDNGIIFDTYDVVQECEGFVIMSSEPKEDDEDIFEIKYDAYIKCGRKYTTPGYDYYMEN